jgi:hypothetical protein
VNELAEDRRERRTDCKRDGTWLFHLHRQAATGMPVYGNTEYRVRTGARGRTTLPVALAVSVLSQTYPRSRGFSHASKSGSIHRERRLVCSGLALHVLIGCPHAKSRAPLFGGPTTSLHAIRISATHADAPMPVGQSQ